ncbi:MAG: NAD(P)-dependent iron-only hydrogenase catalytic subunit [Candidatus Peregrinibacteria bacterium GW2011_GWA2_33_10]|nr:MAG: NAD(P)-dependent iron-only hydrogenase catalytic subunit [Candidatus Peregrinibacteria bacterium GW2011_GWA2_33_10]
MKITINNKKYRCKENESVLEIAIRNNIFIPHFCFHEDLKVDANCRTCLVENCLDKKIVTSCTLKARKGLKVGTDSEEVKKLRKINLELLLSKHKKFCSRCKKGDYCKVFEIMKKYKILGDKYEPKKIVDKIHKMGSAAEFDPKACIACNKCVEMCEKIGICYLKLKGKGAETRISYNEDPNIDCIYCGQCTVHCPVGAIREQSHLEEVEKALKDKNKIVIAQMAPSVRASIGEEFGLEPGINLEKKLYTAFRKLGFDKIFDVNMGADITTMVEARELVERIKNGGVLPMFTSCCPGWVKFVEFYYPEMIDYLTTSRSPQIHSGGAYKTWWAEKEKVDPKKIVVISFMPCTSKKYEAKNPDLKVNGMNPVDFVLTTRELAVLLKRHNIDLPKLKDGEVDKFGEYSGAAAIYGASGGVMESALRTACYLITGKNLKKLDFNEVRGMKGVKIADIKIGKKILKVAVVGQPIPSTEKIIAKRIEALYKIDKKMKMREAHKNEVVREFLEYTEKLTEKKKAEILERGYCRRGKGE